MAKGGGIQAGLSSEANKLIGKLISVLVVLAVATGFVISIHNQFTWFIANLTGATLSTAATLAGIIENVFWILIVVSVLTYAFKH